MCTAARCAPASYWMNQAIRGIESFRSEIKITVFQLFILYFAHLFVTLTCCFSYSRSEKLK